jgi:hypothetical protein
MSYNRNKKKEFYKWNNLIKLLAQDKLGCSIISILDDYDTLQVFKLVTNFKQKPYWKQIEIRVKLKDLANLSIQHQRQKILQLLQQED